MKPIHVGLVADPASPTHMAHRISDLDPPDDGDAWDIEVVSERSAGDVEPHGRAVRPHSVQSATPG